MIEISMINIFPFQTGPQSDLDAIHINTKPIATLSRLRGGSAVKLCGVIISAL